MGGSFVEIFPEFEVWKSYSVAHGLFNDDGEPWRVKDILSIDESGETNDVFGDLKSGLRLLVRRRLGPDWFVTFRRDVLGAAQPGNLQIKYAGLFEEICTTDEGQIGQQILDTYKRLRTDEKGPADPAWWKVTSSMVRDAALSFASDGESSSNGTLSDKEAEDIVAGLDLSFLNKDKKAPPTAASDSPKVDSPSVTPKKPTKIDFFDLLVDLDQS